MTRPPAILSHRGATEERRASEPTKGCPCTDKSRQSSRQLCVGSAAHLLDRQLHRRGQDGEARHHLLLAGLKDEHMGSRGANTTLQITYLNSVVMPDAESSSSSEEDDENDDGSSAADDVDE